MRAGAGRAGGLNDVVRAQLERWQDHPNAGRDSRVDDVFKCPPRKSSTSGNGCKKEGKKENFVEGGTNSLRPQLYVLILT
jgi:hypothetical protein